MGTVWHVGRVTTSTRLRSFNEIITEHSGSSTVGTGDRRPGMALLSAGRETSQTLKIPGRTLERRIGQKTNSREKLKQENTLDLHKKEAQIVQGPFLEGDDPQTCHKERRYHKLKERRWNLALERNQSEKKGLTLRWGSIRRSANFAFRFRRRTGFTDATFLVRRWRRSKWTSDWCFRRNTGFTRLRLQFGKRGKYGTVRGSTRLSSFSRSSHRWSRRRNWIRRRKRTSRDRTRTWFWSG